MTNKASEIVAALRKKKLGIDIALLSAEDSPCAVDEWISTGCLALDVIMGGGLPFGRMTEIYGDPSSGKSLIAAQIAAQAQAQGCLVGYGDTETAVSKGMMKKVGVNVDELIYASPDTVEEVFKFFYNTIELAADLAPDAGLVLIWDSIAATSSRAEMAKEYGETGYLDHSRIISQALRKITRTISKQRVAMLFLNQTRSKIGVMFGDKVATFGGKAVSFHASIRVYLDLSSKLKRQDGKKSRVVGMNTKAVCVKNKVSEPFREATLPIYFGHGIDDALASLHWLVDNGYVTGTQTKVLELPSGTAVKFNKATWEKVYDKHYDEIGNMMLDSIDEDYDDSDN